MHITTSSIHVGHLCGLSLLQVDKQQHAADEVSRGQLVSAGEIPVCWRADGDSLARSTYPDPAAGARVPAAGM